MWTRSCLVPGVGQEDRGPPVARLKARLDLPTLGRTAPGGSGADRPAGEVRAARSSWVRPEEIRAVMDGVDEGEPVEEMVRTALRQLARNR